MRPVVLVIFILQRGAMLPQPVDPNNGLPKDAGPRADGDTFDQRNAPTARKKEATHAVDISEANGHQINDARENLASSSTVGDEHDEDELHMKGKDVQLSKTF